MGIYLLCLAVLGVLFWVLGLPDPWTLAVQWASGIVFALMALALGMGLLGEYIGRLYTDVRARPRYFIHQIVRSATTPSQQEAEQ